MGRFTCVAFCLRSLLMILGMVLTITASVFAVTKPQGRPFPPAMLEALQKGLIGADYGDSSWVARMEKSALLRQSIALGKAPAAAIAQQKFTLPVLLGQYSDSTGTLADSLFQEHLFGNNPSGSLIDYYNEISSNQFTLTGTVYGWFSAGPYEYYTGDNNGRDLYPRGVDGFVHAIVQIADSAVDYALFDNDGPDGIANSGDDDGYVDAVMVVTAGVGPDGYGGGSNIWPQQGHLGSDEYTTGDNGHSGEKIKINAYCVCPELKLQEDGTRVIRPIGVYAHEFGHVFGLPDLYDRTGADEGPDFNDSEGIGEWGLMGSGSWGGDGQHEETPAHMIAWSKMKMGWITPVVLENDSLLTLSLVETTGTVYQLWEDDFRDSRYFLLENRQKAGFDRFLNGEGLMIYHVDESLLWNGNNDDETHKLVDIEEADGRLDLDDSENRGDDGDPWLGSANKTVFDNFSTPNTKDYENHPTGIAVNNINLNGTQVSASVKVKQSQGYTILYDEEGLTGNSVGFPNPNDTWGAVKFQTHIAGTLEEIQFAVKTAGMPYEVKIFDTYLFQHSGNTIQLSGFKGVVSGVSTTPGWITLEVDTLGISLAADDDFFITVKYTGLAYAIPYDGNGDVDGRSYYSFDDGLNFDNDAWEGDFNIRAVIRTVAKPAANDPVLPPSSLNAVDHPGDTGGRIDLRFIASPHHPGSSGTQQVSDPLTGYQVWYSTGTDSAAAQLLNTLPVSSVTLTGSDTALAVVAAPDSVNRYNFWIRAVIGDRQSPLTGANATRPVHDGLAAQGDLNGNMEVDIFDVARIAEIFGNAAEYEPVFDLSGNGEIDIFDVAEIAKIFGRLVTLP